MKKANTTIKMMTAFILLACALLLPSCEAETNEDIVKSPSHDGSVETVISIEHKNTADILHTTHKIWVKNTVVKTVTISDTLPSLGSTVQTGENSEGETKAITVPKNYELYITVK